MRKKTSFQLSETACGFRISIVTTCEWDTYTNKYSIHIQENIQILKHTINLVLSAL